MPCSQHSRIFVETKYPPDIRRARDKGSGKRPVRKRVGVKDADCHDRPGGLWSRSDERPSGAAPDERSESGKAAREGQSGSVTGVVPGDDTDTPDLPSGGSGHPICYEPHLQRETV